MNGQALYTNDKLILAMWDGSAKLQCIGQVKTLRTILRLENRTAIVFEGDAQQSSGTAAVINDQYVHGSSLLHAA